MVAKYGLHLGELVARLVSDRPTAPRSPVPWEQAQRLSAVAAGFQVSAQHSCVPRSSASPHAGPGREGQRHLCRSSLILLSGNGRCFYFGHSKGLGLIFEMWFQSRETKMGNKQLKPWKCAPDLHV